MGVLDRDRKTGAELLADGIKRQRARVLGPTGTPSVAPESAKSDVEPSSEIPQAGKRLTYHRPRNGMLGFQYLDSGIWQSAPARSFFKPAGLFIVGSLPPDALLSQAFIGHEGQVLGSAEGVPVQFFMSALSYAQIAEMVKDGDQLPAWCDWDIVYLGNIVRIEIRMRTGDPCEPARYQYDLGMWGVYGQ